jgi:hypothetical protein
VSNEQLPFDETYLRERLTGNPADWDTRLRLAYGLYEREAYADAAEVMWSGRFIPCNNIDLTLAILILSKAQTRKSIRLLTAVHQMNQGNAANNMAMANAMVFYGMILEATRFYGAAMQLDSSLLHPDFEYLILCSDDRTDTQSLFHKKLIKDGETPTRVIYSEHPIDLNELAVSPGEEFNRALKDTPPAKAAAPATPISKSSVPTSLLHLKWSTVPAKPGDPAPVAAPPVAAPQPAQPEPPAPGPRKLNIPGR